MRVPFEWLKEFVTVELSPEDLALKLTMAGLEVEAIETVGGDPVFEINVTPNRPDCLSILGVSREVSALLGVGLKFPDCRIKEETGESKVHVEIIDKDLCYRYAGRDIGGVKIGESPSWMKKRLEQCGMRPINNIVDITNYVLLEMGHPLHAFDRSKLAKNTIRVARARGGGGMTTLDGTERLLPEEALLIWDAERPVAVAGIMGGSDSEVTDQTKDVFLESAYFFPASIRRTSKTLGLKTESSYRFERGTDIELLVSALDRAASLMGDIAGGRVSKRADAYPVTRRAQEITVRYERINKILGTSIAHGEMVDIARRLGLDVKEDLSFFVVTPPSFRTDIQREIDVIEEIARLHGYEKIPVTIPNAPITREAGDGLHRHISAIGDFFRFAGFTETINYSFMDSRMLDVMNIGNDDIRRKTVTLKNPLNEAESHLRTTLIPSLIQNLMYNVSMGGRDVRFFEISRVFIDRGEALPEERHHLGSLFFREKAPSLWKEDAPDFYVVKGTVEGLLNELKLVDYTFGGTSEPFLHPGKSCDITVKGRKIGFLGMLHPDVVEKLALKLSRPDIVILEIDMETLLSLVSGDIKYVPLPKYPHIDRDVALVVDDSISASSITEMMKRYPSELIEDVSIFDFYKGKNIPQGRKSLAFTIRYRAKERTLTDSEIEEVHSGLVRYITDRTGATVRGA